MNKRKYVQNDLCQKDAFSFRDIIILQEYFISEIHKKFGASQFYYITESYGDDEQLYKVKEGKFADIEIKFAFGYPCGVKFISNNDRLDTLYKSKRLAEEVCRKKNINEYKEIIKCKKEEVEQVDPLSALETAKAKQQSLIKTLNKTKKEYAKYLGVSDEDIDKYIGGSNQ